MNVAFPELRQELIQLGEEDQAEIRAHYQTLKSLETEEEKVELESQLKAHCHARAERMMEMLDIIKDTRTGSKLWVCSNQLLPKP